MTDERYLPLVDLAKRLDATPADVARAAYIHRVPVWFRLKGRPILVYSMFPIGPDVPIAPLPWAPEHLFTGWAAVHGEQPADIGGDRGQPTSVVGIAVAGLGFVHRIGPVESDPDAPHPARPPSLVRSIPAYDFGIVDPSWPGCRGLEAVFVDDLRLTHPGVKVLAAKEGWPADLLDAPPPGTRLPGWAEGGPGVEAPAPVQELIGDKREERLLTLLAAAATLAVEFDRKSKMPTLSTRKGRPIASQIATALARKCGRNGGFRDGYLPGAIANDLTEGFELLTGRKLDDSDDQSPA